MIETSLLFITDVRKYKNLLTIEKRKEKAEEIFTKYIKQNSSFEV